MPSDATNSPIDELIRAVREAMKRYDASGDHKHEGGPYPGDCLRCALKPFQEKVNAL